VYNEDTMNYEFTWGSFMVGILIIVAGALLTIYYQWIADNFGNGVGSYDRYRLYGVIACVLGFIVSINLHAMILRFALSSLFPG